MVKLFKFIFQMGVVLMFFVQSMADAQTQQLDFKVKQLSVKDLQKPLSLKKQGSFFVGGRDLDSSTLSTLPAYAASGTVTVDQMYVRYQVPVKPRDTSLVLIHGCCLTGKTWESTPDDRMGWDEYFVRRGYPTYVIDQSGRGRSAVNATAMNAVKMGLEKPENLPVVFAASHEAAWAIFRFGSEYPKAYEGVRFPIKAQGALWQQMVPDWLNALPTPNPSVYALSGLAKQLNKTILISHSQSGIFPFQTAQFNQDGISGIIAVEPGSCPAADGDLTPYKNIPIMVLFGDYVDLSPRWSPRLKACREFVNRLNHEQGGQAQLLLLPEIGIHGNTHMLMQDDNNLEIAGILASWIENRKNH